MGEIIQSKEERLYLGSLSLIIRHQSLINVSATPEYLAKLIKPNLISNGEIVLITDFIQYPHIRKQVLFQLWFLGLEPGRDYIVWEADPLSFYSDESQADLLGRSVPGLEEADWLNSIVCKTNNWIWFKEYEAEYEDKSYWSVMIQRVLMHKGNALGERIVTIGGRSEGHIHFGIRNLRFGAFGISEEEVLNYVNTKALY
ncbi:MAG: hypothetical protein H6606_11470 [Flavobacteriales bacterium]|nr:hypothetical protein [Flavobacteriales bacterium]